MYLDATLPLGDKDSEPLQPLLTQARITLSYADIGGQPYTQRFDIKLNLEMFAREPDDANFIGRLECESVSGGSVRSGRTAWSQIDDFSA